MRTIHMTGDVTLDHYDLRTLEQLLRSETITKKEYDSYLKSLPDSESNAEYIEITDEKSAEDDQSGLTFAPVDAK